MDIISHTEGKGYSVHKALSTIIKKLGIEHELKQFSFMRWMDSFKCLSRNALVTNIHVYQNPS